MRSLAAAAAVLLLLGCDAAAPKFRSIDITGASYGRDFALADPAGRMRTLEEFRGRAVVLFFGFTYCPDICPATLAGMAAAINSLGADAQRVQVVFITVDPGRDTPEVLARYVTAFDPGFLALRGDEAATRALAKEFKVYYEKRPGQTPGAYTVDHTSASFVFDPQGRLRLYVRHDRLATDLAADLKTLLRG